jgi:hypothetical protein
LERLLQEARRTQNVEAIRALRLSVGNDDGVGG